MCHPAISDGPTHPYLPSSPDALFHPAPDIIFMFSSLPFQRSRQNNSSAVYERAFESAMRSDRGVLPAYLPSKVSARPRSTSTSASAEIHSVSSSTETQRVVEPPVDMDELLSAIKNERMRDLVDGLD
jgi:hypothetical protein